MEHLNQIVKTMPKETLLKIAIEYTNKIQEITEVIESHYSTPLINGLKEKAIPKSGSIGEFEFEVHGVGIRVTSTHLWLNWDFPKDPQNIPFDPWKLWCYTRDHPKKYGEFSDLNHIHSEVKRLLNIGILSKATDHSNCYFINSRNNIAE